VLNTNENYYYLWIQKSPISQPLHAPYPVDV
jgi:hypothetical protein